LGNFTQHLSETAGSFGEIMLATIEAANKREIASIREYTKRYGMGFALTKGSVMHTRNFPQLPKGTDHGRASNISSNLNNALLYLRLPDGNSQSTGGGTDRGRTRRGTAVEVFRAIELPHTDRHFSCLGMMVIGAMRSSAR
jgi:hypothetical protein